MEKRLLKNLDWTLLGAVVLLVALGLTMVASATQFKPADASTWGYVVRQAVWFGIGLAAMTVVVAVDYHVLARWTRGFYIVNLLGLLAVRLVGKETLGAARWIQVGPVVIQPSEFAKLLIIITLAAYLARREGDMRDWRDLVMPALHILPPMALILAQPDLGTSLVLVAILYGMLYVGGVPGARLAGLGLGGLALAVGYIIAHFQLGVPVPLKEYQLKRLIVFVNPESDPLGAGYHILQSETAVGSGRLLGRGLFAGTQNQLNYLPEQHTDFIFSVIGEELGFLGGVLVLGLFFVVLWRGLEAAAKARDLFGSLLAAGVVSMLGFHVLVNIGMTIGVMPVTGVPLPFISYGGSSLLTNSLAVGLLLNIYMRRQKILF